ncbi:MAG TPA: hydroxymethylbilane synthase [Opitutaceae bacterium]|nr:hydroxymethylbilane synthase [Opitutaceae bacterium]
MPFRLATRKSPLALVQARMVADRLRGAIGAECTLLPMVSTGDRRTEWSLEQRGGKGLFTAELEESLLKHETDLAVHSSKDLPGDMPPGLELAGFLPRADARDVLVVRHGGEAPRRIATGSPRRRSQLQRLFPGSEFTEIRGNVDTRLKKIAAGEAEATVLAAAGLARLGIASWPELEFRPFSLAEFVPAVGQGAIAVQCRAGEAGQFSPALDPATARAVRVERALQAALGAGCHTALGAHVSGTQLHLFHPSVGVRQISLTENDLAHPAEMARKVIRELQLA